MKSVHHQAAVTSAVQATVAKYPSISLLPEQKGEAALSMPVKAPYEEVDYVTALYEFFNLNPEAKIVGRRGMEIVGK